jgi:hypothetical protein
MSHPRGTLASETILKIATQGMPVGCQVSRVGFSYTCGARGCDVDVLINVRTGGNSAESIAWEQKITRGIRQLFSRYGYRARIRVESHEGGVIS